MTCSPQACVNCAAQSLMSTPLCQSFLEPLEGKVLTSWEQWLVKGACFVLQRHINHDQWAREALDTMHYHIRELQLEDAEDPTILDTAGLVIGVGTNILLATVIATVAYSILCYCCRRVVR